MKQDKPQSPGSEDKRGKVLDLSELRIKKQLARGGMELYRNEKGAITLLIRKKGI